MSLAEPDTAMTGAAAPRPGMPEGVEIVAASPASALACIETVVCIPTYRRPDMLEDTLRSLAAQQVARPFAVVVVENEGTDREGAARAAGLHEAGLFRGLVLVEPRQGNCKAYNAAWSCALAWFPALRFVAGIDDDELAEPGWLAAFLDAAAREPAALFGGSVTPRFEDTSRAWLAAHPVFRSHYERSGPVPILYSSANYLIRREVLDRLGHPFLDERFDFTGGGDSDFFSRAKAAGFGFHWVQEAAQRETMPARRTQTDWVVARALRNGALSAMIERRRYPGPLGRLRVLAKSLALLGASPWRGLVLGLRTRSALIGLYHAQVAWGRIASGWGAAREQYRRPEAN